jgi:serine protease Do
MMAKSDLRPHGKGWGALALMVALTVVFGLAASQPAAAKSAAPRMVPESFHGLSQMVGPSVVNIRTVKTLQGGGPVSRQFKQNPWGKNHPFNELFERFFGGEEFQHEFKQRSLGSGFIISDDGFVVTNNHVIEDADEITVKLAGGDEFEARIVGRDPNTDLALIRIESEDRFPAIPMGNSDGLKVGEWVVAIGSPFGLEQTVTAGIVSAKGRVIGSGPYDDFIQTDASINPGNSGGPLINMNGEVVGINTAIIAAGQGIGFAVPINMARNIIEQLREHGEVTRGWLGVAIQELDEEMAEYYGVEKGEGVFVAKVFDGDPADAAGIRAGDIIVSVDGKKVSTTRELTGLIAGIPVGKKAAVNVLREGKKKQFVVEIAKREEEKIASGRPESNQSTDDLGIRVADVNAEMANRFGATEGEGVIVVGVENGSKGQEAGIRRGDIIREINHESIRSSREYHDAIAGIDAGETVSMFVRRMNAGFLVVKMTK